MIVKGNIEIIEGTMCNVYVFKLNDKIIQVDAGMKGSAKKIIDYYQKRNLRPDVVLITHYHIDHIGSLKIIKEKYNPEIYAN
ncbi:MAG: MBL fold metallo-hydrolase, partial [Thermoplasmata archaeon]|nr:MBL fold metallo-hydrolase [Thermoplasmata archaeon]